jgi:hypothetical protein
VASVALPLAAAQPAAAQYGEGDFQVSEVTFTRNGQSLTCSIGGQTAYWFPEGDDETALIRALTLTDDNAGCRAALFQVSVSGRYETAPDSNQFVAFAAEGAPASGTTPAETSATAFVEAPGPTGHIETTHLARFRCDDPPAGATFCSVTASTSAK